MDKRSRQLRFNLILMILWVAVVFYVLGFGLIPSQDNTAEVELLKAKITALEALNALPDTIQTITVEKVVDGSNWELIKLTSDYEELCRIVESEATGEGFIGKLAVAEVVINRVKSDKFGATIHDVIFEPGQFDPIVDGRFESVVITDETRRAVDQALQHQSTDALFFLNPVSSGPISRGWVRRLEYVATVGNHNFYK